MALIKVRQHIGSDGILHLDIPVGLIDREIEVTVTYQPVPRQITQSALAAFYGVCADDPIILDDRGVSEALDDDMADAFE